jgi:hypothetical protein
MSTPTVADLVPHATRAERTQTACTKRQWREYVDAAVAGKEVDPDAFAAFCVENNYDPEDFAREVDIRTRRAEAQRIVDDRERRREVAQAAREKLDAAIGEYNAKLAALQVEASARIAALTRAHNAAESDAQESIFRAGQLRRLDAALSRLAGGAADGTPET